MVGSDSEGASEDVGGSGEGVTTDGFEVVSALFSPIVSDLDFDVTFVCWKL